MKLKNKIFLFVLAVTITIFVAYFTWLALRPVKIVAVHHDGNYSSVLVQSFPVTDRGKINWWLENKDRLKKTYDIPRPASYGNFNITFWLFGDGYKEEGKYDRLCFNDIPTRKNCIEKDSVFSVYNDSENRIYFTVYDGTYLLQKNGEIVKYEFKGEAW